MQLYWKETTTKINSCEICEHLWNFLVKIPVLRVPFLQNISSDCFWRFQIFSPQLYIKRDSGKDVFCDFCKIFKNIFSFDRTPRLLVFICEFWDVFQNTSFIEHLRETAILCTSCRISTTRYSKKLFHMCFSSILYQIEKHPLEGIHLLKIPENCLWRS